jgi:hypothetical protein
MCEETSERAMTGRDLANTIFVYFSELSVVLLYDYYFYVVLLLQNGECRSVGIIRGVQTFANYVLVEYFALFLQGGVAL